MDPAIQLLRDLVAIDSVNPLLVPGAAGEAAVAAAVSDAMRRIGMDVELQEAAPGRPNVVGVLEGRAAGRSLMFCGHTDTVGVEGMTAPFDPVQRDGRLYGRGAQDMKGGVAAMIDAARIVADAGVARGRLVIAAVIDEEYASAGADALVSRWRADAAVVTEPTDLAIAVAHKGFAWIEVETHGRAAHGSRPAEGRDAIVRMGRVLLALEELDRALQRRSPHALVGTASLHASLIDGGRELSSYPDRCTLKLERRTLPGETPDQVLEEIRTVIRSAGEEAEVRNLFHRSPLTCDRDAGIARCVRSSAEAVTGRAPREAGVQFWMDAAIFGEAGIPTVNYGPSGEGAHEPVEWVDAESLVTCARVLAECAPTYHRYAPAAGTARGSP